MKNMIKRTKANLAGKLDFSGASARDKAAVLNKALVGVDGVVQGALNIVHNVVRGTSERSDKKLEIEK